MKILIVGDTHFRSKTPRCRVEKDFAQVSLNKFKQVLDICDDYDCGAIIQPGDFFHTPDPSKALVSDIILAVEEMKEDNLFPIGLSFIYTIFGQHDLTYHSLKSMKNSTLQILESANTVSLLKNSKPILVGGVKDRIHGASFGEEPILPDLDHFNILVAHTMVGDKPLWPGHDLTGPEEYVRKHPGYKLYILGDYHYPYTVKVGEATVVNAGCLLRMTADERDRTRKPKVVIFDTEDCSTEDVFLDVADEKDCFDLTKKVVKKDNKFEELVSHLRKTGKLGVNFRDNLEVYYEQHKVSTKVQEVIEESWVVK